MCEDKKNALFLAMGCTMDGFEKRKMERFDLEISAWLYVMSGGNNQELFEYKTKNICAGGAYFDTDSPLAVGTDVQAKITLPMNKFKELGGGHSQIDVSGSVVRADEQGMAVCFDNKYMISPYEM
jgi:hypothetical protein